MSPPVAISKKNDRDNIYYSSYDIALRVKDKF